MFSLKPQRFFALLVKTGLSCAVVTALTLVSQVCAAPGDLYVSESASNSIVVYKPDGSSSTFATGLNSPQGLTFDLAGNLFVADGGSGNVYAFTPEGTRSTVASGFSNPVGVALNGVDLLVSENGADVVTRVAPDGTKSVFPVTVTAPLGLTSVSVNQSLNVYVAAANGAIKVAPDGTSTTVYSGSDSRNVAVDSDGNVFLSLASGEVRKFPVVGPVTTFASGLNDPHGIAFRPKRFSGDTDGIGNLFVADPLGGFIFQVTPDGSKTTFARTGKPNFVVFGVSRGFPTPTPTPSISPSPTPSPAPSVSPSPTPSVSPSPTPSPAPIPALLRNISTRDEVLTGDNVLIGGFIITGGTREKKVVIRAIGPSLSAFGIQNALADPVLELHLPDGTVITNNDWMDNSSADQAALVAASLAPTNNFESAILINLPPVDNSTSGSGLYTAVVRGNNDGTGVALMEVYDLDDALTTTSQLANISTRGFVSTGDNVLIGGFISGPGSDDGKVLMRAVGPSLTNVGVSAALLNPTLELFDSNGDSIAFNDDWQDTAKDEIVATGLAPADGSESAILSALVAGSYTIVVRGVDDSAGVALVEAYHLPNPGPTQ